MTIAWARLSEAKAGLTGSVTMRSASATSSFSSPLRSRPKTSATVSPEATGGAGRHHARLFVGPALPWLDQTQPRQSEIAHGARSGADILTKLRLDQHD